MSAILFALLTAALFYLGSRANITRWLWNRYPAPLARFMDCPACTGFWYGALVAAPIGYLNHLSYLGLDLSIWPNWIVVGVASIVATPIAAGAMQRALDTLGTAVPPAEEGAQHNWTRIV